MGEPEIHEVSVSQLGADEISGTKVQSWWIPQRGVYFNAKFSAPILQCEKKGSTQVLLTFAEDVKDLTVFVGISMTDEANAKTNRIKEPSKRSRPMPC